MDTMTPQAKQRHADVARQLEMRRESQRQNRRREILASTLKGVRRHGPMVSTAQIAALAKCSKETLYSWFEDRDGLMQALVEEQADAMAALLERQEPRLGESVTSQLKRQAVLLLDMMTGDAYLGVHQIAMAQDRSKGGRNLGQAVMEVWRKSVASRFATLMDAGVAQGVVVVYSAQDAFEDFTALLIGDRQRRLLLGEDARPAADRMEAVAEKAVQRWLVLYGV
ncbi:MAG: TetR/AcrR family transcriptional regulator [Pseudomonadota bacterium]